MTKECWNCNTSKIYFNTLRTHNAVCVLSPNKCQGYRNTHWGCAALAACIRFMGPTFKGSVCFTLVPICWGLYVQLYLKTTSKVSLEAIYHLLASWKIGHVWRFSSPSFPQMWVAMFWHDCWGGWALFHLEGGWIAGRRRQHTPASAHCSVRWDGIATVPHGCICVSSLNHWPSITHIFLLPRGAVTEFHPTV